MKNFAEFVKANKEFIYANAESNVKRNAKGEVVITRDDPWFYDDVWDEDAKRLKELIAREKNSAAGSLVC